MRRKWVLYALGQVVKRESRDELSVAFSGCDPLVLALSKGNAIRALREAELESPIDDVAHLARLASFRIAKIEPVAAFDDIDALSREYQETFARLVKPSTGPRLVVGLSAAVLLTIIGQLVYTRVTRSFEPQQTVVGALFQREFTYLASELANGQTSDDSLEAFQHGDLPQASEAAMTALVRAAVAVRGSVDQQVLNRYRAASVKLNRAFEQDGLPYYLDADTFPLGGVNSPTLLSFYVQERGVYTSEQARNAARSVSVLRLWRLDQLNLVQSKLGYTSPATPYAIVLLDEVEQDLVTQILPAVPENELMSLSDEDIAVSNEPWIAELQRRGAALVRRHYTGVPTKERDAAERLGVLLAKRRSLLAQWRNTIARGDSQLHLPRRLIPEADYVAELELLVPRVQLRAWEALHDELLGAERLADFELVREAVIRSVERHEVQHRLDYAAERFEISPLLAHRMGNLERQGHSPYSLPMKASLELSAYLSQIADDPAPLLTIVTMSRMVFVKYLQGTPHSYAALVALESLAQALGMETEDRLGSRVTRQELAALLFELGEFSAEELKAAARKAYLTQFDEVLPHVKRNNFQKNHPWRH